MLGKAEYSSVLDPKAGSTKSEWPRKTVEEGVLVLGLFDYKVMLLGFNSAPVDCHVHINFYFQSLLGHGFITYLGEILMHSSDLTTQAQFLQQMLSTLLKPQLCQKVHKRKFARKKA